MINRTLKGSYTLASTDEIIIDYIVEHGSVSLADLRRVFGLRKCQATFIVRKIKDLASDVVAFSREGRHTMCWEIGKFNDREITPYKPRPKVAGLLSLSPMDKWEKATCILNNTLNELWV